MTAMEGNINFYTLYVSGLDIRLEQSQQNFDDVVNLISLVAQPIIMNNPISYIRRSSTINDWLYMLFKFAVEHPRVFERNGDNVSVLKELFEGVQSKILYFKKVQTSNL